MPNAEHPRSAIVYGCPSSDTAYTQCLYDAVRQRGIEVRETLWGGWWLLDHLRQGDTLHLHWPSFYYYDASSRWRTYVSLARFIVTCLLLRLRGVRIVWTAHNLYPHDGGKEDRAHRIARRFVVGIASRIFVHGPTPARLVREEFGVPPGKLALIPHGHWMSTYPNDVDRDAARRELGLDASSFVYLFIGLCKPYKGLESVIDAMASLEPGGHLVVAGKFPAPAYEEDIRARVKRVAPERITIHSGYVADERIQTFLNATDVVVLPYLNILTSGAAILAMSFGRPVIAPRLGALIDVVDSGSGILYEHDAAGGLQEAMQSARSTRFRPEAIKQHVAGYTWAEAAAALVDFHLGASPQPSHAAAKGSPSN